MGGRGNKGKMDRERREGEDNQMNKPVQSSEPEAKRLGSCGLYTTDHTRLLCSWRVHYKPHSYGKCVFNMQLHTQVWRRGRRKSTWFAPALNHCGDQFASIHSILVMPQTILHVHVCLLMAGYLEIKQLNRLLPLPTKLMYQTMSSDVHSILRKLR